MSAGKILRLDKDNYDLWLTYSWSNNNHGICGHTFEVIDYYLALKEHFRVGMFFAEDIDWPTLKSAIESKYDLDSGDLERFKSDCVFFNRPILVHTNNILFTDGGIRSLSDKTLLCEKIFHFACGDKELQDNSDAKTFVLQDERVHGTCFNSINYKKKICFDRYKKIGPSEDHVLLYGTKNCRHIPDEAYLELAEKFEQDFICLTSPENRPRNLSRRFRFPDLPVENLFEKFGTYVYTPVPRRFDCSPRLIAECAFYGKDVYYHNIDYWEEDLGLYWRKWDIENDFDSLFLTPQDEIVSILKELL